MNAMTKSDDAKKNDNEPNADLDPRKLLLARMAANIAAGIVTAPSKATSNAEAIAAVSVDVAGEILKQVGL
jgi:hypothetical protein